MSNTKNEILEKNRKFKLTHKKYSLVGVFFAIKRRFIAFFSIIFFGLGLGITIYFLSSAKYYSSNCLFYYNGSSLDEKQQEIITKLVVCNEQIDQYVVLLANEGIKNGNSQFSFSDLSFGLGSSVDYVSSDFTVVNFKVSFLCKSSNVTKDVLSVVAQKAVDKLNSIYIRDTFGVLHDSFSAEKTFSIKNKNHLIIPVAFSSIIAVALTFVLEGIDDKLQDLQDCDYAFSEIIFLKNKKNNPRELFALLNSSIDFCFVTDSDDYNTFRYFLDNCSLKLECTSCQSAISHHKILIFDPKKIEFKKPFVYVVFLGETSFSRSYDKFQSILNDFPDSNGKLVCISKKFLKYYGHFTKQ